MSSGTTTTKEYPNQTNWTERPASLRAFVASGQEICAAIETYGGAGRMTSNPKDMAFFLRLLLRQARHAAELLVAIEPEEAKWRTR